MQDLNKKEEAVPEMRQIIIETDGTNVVLRKADVIGLIEFNGILSIISKYINKPISPKKKEEISEVPVLQEEIKKENEVKVD